MKQHITVEELKSVSDETKIKLFKEYYEETDNCEITVTSTWLVCNRSWKTTYRNLAEGITIGKMIEILSNEKQIVIEQGSKWWFRFMDNSSKTNDRELVDELWEAVKEIL